ncbi:MAG: hypothetical protein H7124_07175 [Phycisphaerales bacterium]|nr:hypothetical protein [Hyphomonadaceae bacterium]
MAAFLIFAAALAAFAALLWLIGAREPVYRLRADGAVWFVAVRGGGDELAPGARVLWAAQSDFAFIGAPDAYWSRFLIVTGDVETPIVEGRFEDAYAARVRLIAPPRMALGLIKLLATSGILSRPSTDDVAADVQSLGFHAELMPSSAAIATLLARPQSYAPAMVNFLRYHTDAKGERGGTGRAAYRRYGVVAMRTVYRTGGHLLFYGMVEAIFRQASGGPTMGAWDDVAAMRYPNPRAILSMEHVPAYRAALVHRDAGLASTMVVASTPL